MCLFPVNAEPQEFGRPKLDPEGSLKLPCGKCHECISKRAVDWATRARHEISLHDENSFLTLTYDKDHLPSHFVVKSHFQKFMKRLRKKTKNKLRYIVSHEYGGKTGRPHHHAIIFGYNPPNQTFLQNSPSGEPLYTSPDIENLWTNGFHSIGTANEKTAYYIASYSLKSSSHDVVDPTTGETTRVHDSMDASKRPAIGADFFIQNKQQLVDSGNLLPRYYVKLLERNDPDLLEEYQNNQLAKKHETRGSHQLLAKYKITSQQKQLSDNNFRTTSQNAYENKQYTEQLKFNRDNYVALTKGKKS